MKLEEALLKLAKHAIHCKYDNAGGVQLRKRILYQRGKNRQPILKDVVRCAGCGKAYDIEPLD